MSWVLAFVGFALLIILHEAGHFAAAKAVGMRVERFMLFFPPILAKVRRGETEYGVGAIPLGGYVKITGMSPHEDIPPEHQARAYLRQPVWKRIVVIGAGPLVNFVIAFVILAGIFAARGVPEAQLAVDEPTRGGAAAGVLQPGDRLVSVDGRPGYEPRLSQDEIRDRQEALRDVVNRHDCPGPEVDGCRAAQPAEVVIERDGRRRTVRIYPRYDAQSDRMLIGFTYATTQRDVGAGEADDAGRRQHVARHHADGRRHHADLLRRAGAQGGLRRRRLLRGHAPVLRVRHGAGARGPRAHLAVARRGQPVPVPAARRRAHLLGAGREGARQADPLRGSWSGPASWASCWSRSCSSPASATTSAGCAARAWASVSVGPWSPPAPRVDAATIAEAFRITAAQREGEVAVRTKDDEVSLTWGELRERVDALAGGLSGLGVGRGDSVALMLVNRPEFHLVRPRGDDVRRRAASRSTRPTRPSRSSTSSATPARASLICEQAFLPVVLEARKELPDLEHVIVDRRRRARGLPLAGRRRGLRPRLRRRGVGRGDRRRRRAHADLHVGHDRPAEGRRARPRQPDRRGRGHRGAHPVPPWRARHLVAAGAHIAERAAHHYLPIVYGLQITCCPDPREVARPTCRTSSRAGSSPSRASGRSSRPAWRRCSAGQPEEQRAARAGGARGRAREGAPRAGGRGRARGAGPAGRGRRRAGLLGRCARCSASTSVEAVNVGAAPTPVEVIEFFHAIGVPLAELWGMSETCGAGTCNPPDRIKIGTVGPRDARGRAQAGRRRRAARARRRRHDAATATCPTRPPRRSTPTAGCTPATSPRSTTTAT